MKKFLLGFLALLSSCTPSFATNFASRTQVDNTTIEYNNNQLRVKAGSIGTSQIASSAGITGSQIASATVTKTNVSGVLGSWDSSASVGTIYQASTDLFVIATVTTQGNAVKSASIVSDSSASPSTTRAQANSTSSTTAVTLMLCTFVRKGDYWQVQNNAGSSVSQIYSIPIGT